MGAEMRKTAEARGYSVGREYGNAYRRRVRRAEAALTLSEDEAVAQVLSLSQGPSSSTSSTAMSGVHTPWSHSLSFWLPLLVDASAGSCRLCAGGSITAGVMDAGLLLLIKLGQSMLCPQEEPKPTSAQYRPQGAAQAARFLDRAVVLPERHHEQRENGKDADDAVETQGGLLRLMVEMGKPDLTSQGKSYAGLRAAQAAVPE
eukprot:scaffold3671_cov61-Phaeocystis_antarctica.AAC.5